MRRPRMPLAMTRGRIASKSSPAKRIVPPPVRAFLAIVPRIAFASVVLPQPDSPTSPMISPGRIVRLTPSSTRAGPDSVANETKRFSTSRRLSPADGTADPRVEHVTQTVAEEVESHHDEEDREPGRERVPPRLGEKLARLGNHAAPLGRRRRRAQTEEAERARGEDGESHADRGAHDDRRHHGGKHVGG